MAVHIGTSGWSYDHWFGVLYPKGASSLGRLDAYARHFSTVEVNNTFTGGRRTTCSRPGTTGCRPGSSCRPRRRGG